MAIQLINIGQIANDGTGDDLREAMIKINQNFEELDLRDDEQTTASNIGSVGEGIFANRVNYDLQFKKIVAGSNVTLTATDETITFDTVGGLQQLVVVSDNGSIVLADGDSFNVFGGVGIETSVSGNTITITNTSSELATDLTPQLGGNLDAHNFDITAVRNIQATSFNGFLDGNMEGNVWGIDVRELNSKIQGFDFGNISGNITSIVEWFAQTVEVDFGTFVSPSSISSDFGSI